MYYVWYTSRYLIETFCFVLLLSVHNNSIFSVTASGFSIVSLRKEMNREAIYCNISLINVTASGQHLPFHSTAT